MLLLPVPCAGQRGARWPCALGPMVVRGSARMAEAKSRQLVAGFEDILLDQAEAALARALAADTPRVDGAHSMAAILLAVAALEAQVGIWAAVFRDERGIRRKIAGIRLNVFP